MKWLFINAIKHQDWGGMENWMLNLCRALPALGESCLMVGRPSSRWPVICRDNSVPFQPCPFGGDLSPWVTLRLRSICRDFQPDIAVVKGFRQARFLRQAWPSTTIAVKLPAANELTPALADRLTFRYCVDRVLVDNHAARNAFLQLPWVLPGKIAAIHNGVAIPDPASLPPERQRLRELFRLSGNTPVIGASGRLVPGKAFDDAIRALAGVTTSPAPHLVLFGDGPGQAALQALAIQLGVGERIHFAGWRDDARRLLWGCDAVIHPSLSEGLPNIVLESMAGGVPVVATRVGGTPEIFADDLAEYVVAPRDPRAMTSRLQRLLSDPDQRSTAGLRARQHVERNFSLTAMAAGIRAALTTAARLRHAARAIPVVAEPEEYHWLADPEQGPGFEAFHWPRQSSANEVSRSAKATVHHLSIGGKDYYTKHFSGDRWLLRRAGLRRPAALENFRAAQRIQLLGGRTVPHLAAGWGIMPFCRNTSILVTGVLPGLATADRWVNTHPPVGKARRIFVDDMARWLAHLHGSGIACHDLKFSNILVGETAGRYDFILLDLDNCRLRFLRARNYDVQRNLHQLFRSFQQFMTPREALRFMAGYRSCARLSKERARRIFQAVEKRLQRHGSGFGAFQQREPLALPTRP